MTSPILGLWSDRRPTKEPLIIIFLISIVANLSYCYAGALPSGGEYMVLVARIVLGGATGEKNEKRERERGEGQMKFIQVV